MYILPDSKYRSTIIIVRILPDSKPKSLQTDLTLYMYYSSKPTQVQQ